MTQHKIIKIIDFCYGHRLLHYAGKCAHLHGHNARLEVNIEANQLDSIGMVVDFKLISEMVKKWIDEHLDHRMLLCKEDPIVPMLLEMNEELYLMDDNPTAENIAKLIFNSTKQLGLEISEVSLWETPCSCAIYRDQDG